jgi:hypothetical protein
LTILHFHVLLLLLICCLVIFFLFEWCIAFYCQMPLWNLTAVQWIQVILRLIS